SLPSFPIRRSCDLLPSLLPPTGRRPVLWPAAIPPISPYTTLFRSFYTAAGKLTGFQNGMAIAGDYISAASFLGIVGAIALNGYRSEEHTSELQSRFDLVCRLLLEKKKRRL